MKIFRFNKNITLSRSFNGALSICLAVLLVSCTVGPNYVRPQITAVPTAFKEQKGWKPAQPNDNALPEKWWTLFNDPDLNALEEHININNQSIAEAEAQYRQSQQVAQTTRSAYFPSVTVNATTNRFRAATGQSVAVSGVRSLFGALLSVAWEPDLWGSVRRQVEADTSNVQVNAAMLQALRLSTQATLAQNYFLLRTLDTQQHVLNDLVATYQKSLEITQNRYAAGISARSDVIQAEAQMNTTRAQASNIGIQRAQMEHALAVLIGKKPHQLSVADNEQRLVDSPEIPVTIPSALLERRPDIAASERQIAAANAKIGVAKAAYYPNLNLAVGNGYQSNDLFTVFTAAHRYWALGPASLALALLDGGARNAQLKQTIEAFKASLAHYQQTVLTAFQEVEDNIAALRILEDEIQSQRKALELSREAVNLIENRYNAGTVSYLEVMTAQAIALKNEQTTVQLLGERLNYSVLLIKALGGGWRSSLLPNKKEAMGKSSWKTMLPFPSQ